MIVNKYVIGISAQQRLKGLTMPVIVVGKLGRGGVGYSKKCANPDIVLSLAEQFKIQGAATSEFEKFFNMEIQITEDNEVVSIRITGEDKEVMEYKEKDMYDLLFLLFRGELII